MIYAFGVISVLRALGVFSALGVFGVRFPKALSKLRVLSALWLYMLLVHIL